MLISQDPLLSVIIPVRNSVLSLGACLKSLNASTYTNYEVLVVDDASTDVFSDLIFQEGVKWFRLSTQRGPAAARNHGAMAARGRYLLFIDADVCVHSDTLTLVVDTLTNNPRLDAVFGSYDLHPRAGNFLSQYKNLLHHFVHQQSAEQASTFWSGCGAIKRSVFLEFGGFDTSYGRPCIEDIELGIRLRKAGATVALRKDIQVMHLKCWTFWGLIKTDIWDRGIPWTQLILRERMLPNDLNLTTSHRASTLLSYSLLVVLGFPFQSQWFLVSVLFLCIVMLNTRLYLFFARERTMWFAVQAVFMHIFYYLYSGAAFACGVVLHAWNALCSSQGCGRDSIRR